MNKKTFSASNWFAQEKIDIIDNTDIIRDRSNESSPSSSVLAPFMEAQEEKIGVETDLNRFFIPGWKGESLISKNIKSFIKTLDIFHKDAYQQFIKNEKFSKRLKISIYEEFIDYANHQAIACAGIENYLDFWSEVKNPDSEFRADIEHFITIFSFRIVVIYLLKVRFISSLHEKTNLKFEMKNIYYPNSFLTSIFRPASSTELKARSFEQNIFSWYRPSSNLKDNLLTFKDICGDLKITDIIKTISLKSEEILAKKNLYSHSISHKQFGLFLNSLLINFPAWKNTLNEKNSCAYKIPNQTTEIISCKYTGDYLESLSLSHWLAQDLKKDIKWDQILCPDFKDTDFSSGIYFQHINELQFLTFLTEIASLQGREPISFICDVINSHLRNRTESHTAQSNMFLEESTLNISTYDRVIVNLNLYPKNNPGHYLFNQISSQLDQLKDDGLIFVFSSKKMFTPSQKSKVEQLLKDFKVEGVFDLEKVEGKGEIGNFLYILSKRNNLYTSEDSANKQACLKFRFSGTLTSFHKFEKVTLTVNNFFKKHIGDLPAIYQTSDTDIRMEFFQDAIIAGQLINSSTKDSANITHPGFFKKLMGMCHPLSDFFDLNPINLSENFDQSEAGTFFADNHGFEKENSPHIIIVDQRLKDEVKIEIISSKLLEVKAYEYGHNFCSYFYAYPKWTESHFSPIQDFLKSSIGKQIINLTFNNELRKVKGNLSKLLIPKFFKESAKLPSHLLEGLKLLTMSPEDITNLHPSGLEKAFHNLEAFLPNIAKDYPCAVLSLLSHFNKAIEKSDDMLGDDQSQQKINFNNPILKTPLLMTKTNTIYPHNQDVFADFNGDCHHLIHNRLDKIKRVQETIHGEQTFGIELIHQNEKVLTLYSDEDMTAFLEFLLKQTIGMQISQILKNVAVPQLADLKPIVSSYKSLTRTIKGIQTNMPLLSNRLIRSAILEGK